MSPDTITPPLKYHGGKTYLAPRIWTLAPPHTHYVEPYAGGLAVLLARPDGGEGASEVVNDIAEDLTIFWRVMRCDVQFPRFQRLCEATPFSDDAWQVAQCVFEQETEDEAQLAWAFFVRCRQSLAGRMASFAPLSRNRTRRGMNEQASAWLTTIEGLPAVHQRLKRVVVLNRQAMDVVRQQDGDKTLFYLDPPYFPTSRSAPDIYAHEMTAGQHGELLTALATVRGKFLLSGYRCPVYDQAAERHGWRRVDWSLPNNAAGGAEKRRMVESVWMNFTPAHSTEGASA